MLFSVLITCSVMATLLYTVRSLIQPRESISAKTALKYQTERSDLKLKPAEKRSSLSLRVSTEDNKRWNVIILTHMSSGSTLTGNLFNLHPDVFYLYEPLHNLRRKVYNDEWNPFDDETNRAYTKDFFDLFRDCLGCGFLKNNTLYRSIPPFARGKKHFTYWRYSTPEFTKEAVRDACRGKKITVAKVMQTRLPREIGIKELERVCRADPQQFDCLIIHLVRDPRAVISSLLRRKFFAQGPEKTLFYSKNLTSEGLSLLKRNVQLLCSQVTNNLNYVRDNWATWFQGRYKLVRYEDIAGSAMNAAKVMYDFVGLPMTNSIYQWIAEGRIPTEIEFKIKAFMISEDNENRISYWRLVRDPSLVSLVEEACAPLMKGMGYILINGSEDHQHDLNVTLISKEIPILKDLR